MRDLAILMFQTLDGVVEAPVVPDGERAGAFSPAGWASAYWPGVMAHVGREAMSVPYDMLFGRKTYDAFAAFWPHVRDDPAADRMNAARKYVVSGGAPDLGWTNSHLVTGDIPAQIRRLKQRDGPLLQVHGSARLVQTLVAHDLVDEFRLWTFPVLVGSGQRLFEAGGPSRHLALARSEAVSNGVVMTVYRRADSSGPVT